MTQLVWLEQATDAELQIAGKYAGIDEMGRIGAGLVEADKLDPEGRKMLIGKLKECGYKAITIDPNNRITNPDALVPFDIATPVE